MKFRKKPVVIDALQWLGDNDFAISVFCKEADIRLLPVEGGAVVVIHTLEGDMRADQGDWIIKGVKGEFYPCKPDIFSATYEAV